ncbi:prenyltransferase [Salibacterium halotolerans]|uniref:1,4-dihydroxy-2-naphthoate octaprenyltransferase n=1 Tax=Salibacterium halotolerans TaxID=1884432 RepID=A0A1I5S5Q2_9BACI|nr:prenyltransferase [Salibacterium halotolerans]SFP66113.1 1,4-dihydroxy-2-naphthoate octaprenyltransferase [Salibacterium halotolerans]
MINKAGTALKNGIVLLRWIAVVSSSVAAITSTMLPLYGDIDGGQWSALFLLLLFSAFLIHGVLTHLLNDYTDYLSGTDEHSPAILSGGSRLIQTGAVPAETIGRAGKSLAAGLALLAAALLVTGFVRLGVLLAVGVWAAVSYSLRPLRTSYYPVAGEWISTFPSLFFLGLAGPWLALETLPQWAFQNALVNALICIAWVMVHHIPDVRADARAVPKKQTSVVWAAERFGFAFSRLPAVVYYVLTGACAFWLGIERLPAALGTAASAAAAIFLIVNMNVDDPEEVSKVEKWLLLLAIVTAVWLGIFV